VKWESKKNMFCTRTVAKEPNKKKINQEKQVDWMEVMKKMNYKGIEVVPQ
jgi:hypothetical protein